MDVWVYENGAYQRAGLSQAETQRLTSGLEYPHCELLSEREVFIWLPRLVRGYGGRTLACLMHVVRRTYIDWDGEVWSEHYFIGTVPS